MTTSETRTTTPERAWLDVPFSEKDQAKAHGARWDPAAKRWYDPRPTTAGLRRWAPLPEVPDLLPGEDRSFGSGLFVDMIPRTCWFTNVRTCVSERDWERLRRMIVRRAGHRCEACGTGEDRDARRWLEAHERWSYDDRTDTQTLRRLICLCSPCHLVTHLGYANVTGRADEALTHLREVTGMSDQQVNRHVKDAGRLWTERSARHWRLDLRMLTDAGVTLRRPEGPGERARSADRALAQHRASPAPSRDRSTGGERDLRVNALMLDGWEHTSTWGVDDGLYYAQLSRNGVSDAGGPQICIGPPRHIVRSTTELLQTIADATGAPAATVDVAMRRGLAVSRGDRVTPAKTPAQHPPSAPVADLAGARAGQGVTREAARRRTTEGAGADRSWRVGADGEVVVGALLAELTEPSLWARLRGRRPVWHVLHSVPLGDGHGNERGDIDHVLVGPPGIVTINTKHHRTGKLVLDGDELILNGHRTDYIPKARREADRADQLVRLALVRNNLSLAGVRVRPLIVIVGGRLTTRQWAPGVSVVMTDRLLHTVQAFPATLVPSEVDAVLGVARRAATWNPPLDV